MTIQERFTAILDWFSEQQPNPQTELDYATPFELLVAVVLSAQCTDKRVNQITPELFRRYPNPVAMSLATVEDIYELIKSCSYPNNKAKHLAGLSRMLVEQYAGSLPTTVEDLQQLPGVGQKTAHVIASVLYNLPYLAVDTHVHRVANRIGMGKTTKQPEETERILNTLIKPELRPRAHHWLILHGRYVCTARKPQCSACLIGAWCEKNAV